MIGRRFHQEEADRLQDIAWWEWSDDVIKKNRSFFEAGDRWIDFSPGDFDIFKEQA